MSSTNKTANYNLTQFIGSDKPAWLVDYNGDMAAIDAQMKVNADAAAAAQSTANGADGKADANATAISSLNTQINGASGIADDLSSVQGAVNTINSLIGNGTPTTTDKTIIGAINEINGDVTVLKGIKITKRSFYGVADGTKDIGTIIAEAFAAFNTYANGKDIELIELDSTISDLGGIPCTIGNAGGTFTDYDSSSNHTLICSGLRVTTDVSLLSIVATTNGSKAGAYKSVNGVVSSLSDTVPAAGNVAIFCYEYEKLY